MSIAYMVLCNGCGQALSQSLSSAGDARRMARATGAAIPWVGNRHFCAECLDFAAAHQREGRR